MTDSPRRTDLYGRRATSTSRGKTHDRILALQHAPGTIPGAESALQERPAGSIAALVLEFHATWVESKQVTTRRAYERTLTFLLRDLAANGPTPSGPAAALDRDRLVAHLDWRVGHGLDDVGEIQRSALHLARLAEWFGSEHGVEIDVTRELMRAAAAERIAAAPATYHTATVADQLRDTSGDAAHFGVTED